MTDILIYCLCFFFALQLTDDYDKRRLTNLYNTPVESAQVFKRKLLTGGSLPFVYHEGTRITTKSGEQYLIHSTNASGAQVITEARHMSNDWESVGEVLVPKGNQTVGDLMKTARQDGGYNLLTNNCLNTVSKIKKSHF